MKVTLLAGKKIEKIFGTSRVLSEIDIDLFAGDFTVIMGASGSGKSTLLYALSGMDQVSKGEILYKSRDLAAASEKELTRIRATDFGFVFQQTNLISNLTLYENIKVAGLIGSQSSEDEIKVRTEELLERMHLQEAKDRLAAQVSGGEAQRAAVARAVITKPDILFADEPTGALNKSNTVEVLNLLSKLHMQGQTILMVTHDKDAALRGNRILYLEDGHICGELEQEHYMGNDADREKRLLAWLAEMGW